MSLSTGLNWTEECGGGKGGKGGDDSHADWNWVCCYANLIYIKDYSKYGSMYSKYQFAEDSR